MYLGNQWLVFLYTGGDDKRVLLWDVGRATQQPNYRPIQMKATHLSNIFCFAFDLNDDNLISSGECLPVPIETGHNISHIFFQRERWPNNNTWY